MSGWLWQPILFADEGSGGVGIAIETDIALDVTAVNEPTPVVVGIAIEGNLGLPVIGLKVDGWPHDELCPRHLGIYPCAFPTGGGVALTGREPVIASGNGYWRIELGGFYIKDRDLIHLWRALEAQLNGRMNTILVPFSDGKRAPWVTVGGPITVTANAAVAKGSTSIQLNATSAGPLLVGQHFSAGQWGYEITSISGPVGSVYTATIFPKTREAIAAGEALEFVRPVVRCRLENSDGMKLPLHLLKRGDATVVFVEDVPSDIAA